MSAYPTITSGSMAVTRSSRLPVRVMQFADGTEQRFRRGRQLEGFTVVHTGITAADAATLRGFFEATKGAYDIFDFVFMGTTYENCSFDTDEFSASESTLSQQAVTLKFTQRK